MKHYVLGFCFNDDLSRVILIKKQRPMWQYNLLNGVGGKVEASDHTFYHAMKREFEEETGVVTSITDWSRVLLLEFPEVQLQVLACRSSENINKIMTVTDEEVHNILVSELLTYNIVPNVKHLISLSIDHLKHL